MGGGYVRNGRGLGRGMLGGWIPFWLWRGTRGKVDVGLQWIEYALRVHAMQRCF